MKKKELKAITKSIKEAGDPVKNEYSLLNFSIILVNSEKSGNVGSVARVMKNFGFKQLILFNPQCEWNSDYSMGFAMHAEDIMSAIEVISIPSGENELLTFKKLLQRFDIVIGTTGKGDSYTNILRTPLYIHDWQLSEIAENSKIAIIFGRESTGLSNDQISLMDFCLRIPTHPDYPILNQSHAVGIILYELYLKLRNNDVFKGEILPASKEDKDRFLNILKSLMDSMDWKDKESYEKTVFSFKNIIGRAYISKKELALLYSLFQRIQNSDYEEKGTI